PVADRGARRAAPHLLPRPAGAARRRRPRHDPQPRARRRPGHGGRRDPHRAARTAGAADHRARTRARGCPGAIRRAAPAPHATHRPPLPPDRATRPRPRTPRQPAPGPPHQTDAHLRAAPATRLAPSLDPTAVTVTAQWRRTTGGDTLAPVAVTGRAAATAVDRRGRPARRTVHHRRGR